jgi:hypothetical protein
MSRNFFAAGAIRCLRRCDEADAMKRQKLGNQLPFNELPFNE